MQNTKVGANGNSVDIYLRLWVDKAPENKSLLLGYGLIGIAAMTTVVPWFW